MLIISESVLLGIRPEDRLQILNHLKLKSIRYYFSSIVFFLFFRLSNVHSSLKQSAVSPIIIPSSGSSSKYSASSSHSQQVQQAAPIIIPVSSGGSERYTSHSERISETQAAPIVIPVQSGGSERYSRWEINKLKKLEGICDMSIDSNSNSHSEHVSESKAAPVPIVYPTGGSERYSR